MCVCVCVETRYDELIKQKSNHFFSVLLDSFPLFTSINIYTYTHIYIYIYIYIYREREREFLSKRSEEVLLIFFFVFLEISKIRNRMEINL